MPHDDFRTRRLEGRSAVWNISRRGEPTPGRRWYYSTAPDQSPNPCLVHRLRSARLRAGCLTLALGSILAACKGSTSSTGVGNLTVVIYALDTTVNLGSAAVNVVGPSSYTANLTVTGTLSGIAAGSYALSSLPVYIGDPVVSVIDTGVISPDTVLVTTSPVTTIDSIAVSSGANDTVYVAYGARLGSGRVYVSNATGPSSTAASAYSSAQLQVPGSSTPTPIAAVGTTGLGSAGPLAVDARGNLWIATTSGATGAVSAYSPAQQAANTPATPVITVTLGGTPAAMTFDLGGNLWVALSNLGEVVEYTASSLSSSPASPSAAFPVSQLTAGTAAGMSFDQYGNLWLACAASNALLEYGSTALQDPSASTLPIVIYPATEAVDPIFDAGGRLWVIGGNNSVLIFSATQAAGLTPTTSPSTTITFSSAGSPTAAAFDNGYDLWMTMGSANQLIELTAQQMLAPGTQTPTIAVTTSVDGTTAAGLAFNPHGQYTPLYGQHAPPLAATTRRALKVRAGAAMRR